MKARLLLPLLAAAIAAFGLALLLRQIHFLSLGITANDEVRAVLRQSVADQRALARADPQHAPLYRRRYDDARRLLARLDILSLSRAQLTQRFELALLLLGAAVAACLIALLLMRQRDREQRIVVRERQRLQVLEHLSAWQEAARRHAHEIRTPLTAAQLEVGRLAALVAERLPEAATEVRQAEESVQEELEQLRRFTMAFTSFAQVAQPRLREHDLARLVEEFATTFAPTWPRLVLRVEPSRGDCRGDADRDMIRQVLVNLCQNSAMAAGERGANVVLACRRLEEHVVIDVVDDGPGIDADVRSRLFEPYTTTRPIGEGMGLGLAISKKIMLDHGGDLELLDTAAQGAAFRLTLRTEGGAS
jgi:signal transduction histidine kinase